MMCTSRPALLLLISLVACGSAHPPAESGPPGQFRVEYGAAASEFEAFLEGLQAHRFLDTIAARLNDSLALPRDVTLATGHCDQPNASYNPRRHRVLLCYELFEELAERFEGLEGAEYLVSGTVVFALMHELAHALIHVLDLPATGREEDAADQLATLLLLDQGPAGDTLAFGAVGWFATTAEASPLDDLAFSADHGLDLQRAYNILCWIYGRDPDAYPELHAEELLPEHRRDRCDGEYRRLAASWRRLLAPHRRPAA